MPRENKAAGWTWTDEWFIRTEIPVLEFLDLLCHLDIISGQPNQVFFTATNDNKVKVLYFPERDGAEKPEPIYNEVDGHITFVKLLAQLLKIESYEWERIQMHFLEDCDYEATFKVTVIRRPLVLDSAWTEFCSMFAYNLSGPAMTPVPGDSASRLK